MDKVATGVEADEGGSSLPSPRTGVKLRSVIGGFESNFSGVFSTGTCSFPLATGSAADGSVLHQDEGGIGKSIPDAQEISRDPKDFPRAKPEGNLEGRGKSRGQRGWISQ